jgi:organic radical activating enzyme
MSGGKRSMTKTKPFCTVPWDHVYLSAFGQFGLCCVANNPKTDLNFEEHWNSDRMKSIRVQFMNGTVPEKDCSKCLDKRYSSNPSYVYRNRLSGDDYLEFLEQTDSTGKTSYFPRTTDIRTIYCNFKCRICNEHNSSSIKIARGKKVVAINPSDKIEISDERLKRLKYINFCGGEPFMSPYNWELLERISRLSDSERESIFLNFDTNLSFPGNTFEKAMSILTRLPRVRFQSSLDGTGKIGEYIRVGLEYEKFIEHLSRIKEASIETWIQYTGTSLGIQDLHNVVDVCKKYETPFIGRQLYHSPNFYLGMNVVKRDYLEDCLLKAEQKAKGSLIEKQINTFSNYLRSKHSPLVMDKETMIESESLFGDVGFFESKMTGYLNE